LPALAGQGRAGAGARTVLSLLCGVLPLLPESAELGAQAASADRAPARTAVSHDQTRHPGMTASIPAEISVQLSAAEDVLRRHLGRSLIALHLFGSAVDGGLRPFSDIDL